jgi:hypothetical protein
MDRLQAAALPETYTTIAMPRTLFGDYPVKQKLSKEHTRLRRQRRLL